MKALCNRGWASARVCIEGIKIDGPAVNASDVSPTHRCAVCASRSFNWPLQQPTSAALAELANDKLQRGPPRHTVGEAMPQGDDALTPFAMRVVNVIIINDKLRQKPQGETQALQSLERSPGSCLRAKRERECMHSNRLYES